VIGEVIGGKAFDCDAVGAGDRGVADGKERPELLDVIWCDGLTKNVDVDDRFAFLVSKEWRR
jgi:hypothetical protein